MTPEQRAEKLADLAEHVLFSDIPDDSFNSQGVEGRRLLRRTIAAAIRAAVEEAILYHPLIEDQIIAKSNLAFEKGKQVAYEDAAKIVDEDGCSEYCCSDPAFKLSDKIRARARERCPQDGHLGEGK